jgi:hypothetical protein
MSQSNRFSGPPPHRAGPVVGRALLVALMLLLVGAGHASAQRGESRTERLTFASPGKSAMAVTATSDVWCSDVFLGQGIARLSWSAADKAASAGGEEPAMRAEVTMYAGGFAARKFTTLEPEQPRDRQGESPAKALVDAPQLRDPEAQFVVLTDLQPGVNYTWRLAVRSGDEWVPSETLRFQAPICPVDSEFGTEPDAPQAREEVIR